MEVRTFRHDGDVSNIDSDVADAFRLATDAGGLNAHCSDGAALNVDVDLAVSPVVVAAAPAIPREPLMPSDRSPVVVMTVFRTSMSMLPMLSTLVVPSRQPWMPEDVSPVVVMTVFRTSMLTLLATPVVPKCQPWMAWAISPVVLMLLLLAMMVMVP